MTPFEKLQKQRASWLNESNPIRDFVGELQMNSAMKDARSDMGRQIQEQQPFRLAEAGQGVPLPSSVEDAYQQAMRGQGDTSSLPMTTPVPTKEKTKQDQEKTKLKTNAQNQYEKNMRKFMEHREKLIRNSEEQARLMRGGENRVDLSSLMALADSETGSNLARSYKAPMTPQRREQLAAAMEAKAGQGYGALANNEYQMASLQNQRDAAERNAQLREKLLGMKGQKPLSGELSKRKDYIEEAISAIGDMSKSLEGVNSFENMTGFGSNPFTVARDSFTENLGRMQSGGAISKDELKTFRRFAPKITDSPEMRKFKLEKAQVMMERRLSNLMQGRQGSKITDKDFSSKTAQNIPFDPDSFVKGI